MTTAGATPSVPPVIATLYVVATPIGNIGDLSPRALDVLKAAKRPLIILGKGAAYAQADDVIKNFVEKSGAATLPRPRPPTATSCAHASGSLASLRGPATRSSSASPIRLTR